MNPQETWDALCKAWGDENWSEIEALGKRLRSQMADGHSPNVTQHDLGRGLNEVMLKAAVGHIMDRFSTE